MDFPGDRRVLFYSARLIAGVFFISILFFDSILQFTLSNPLALAFIASVLAVLALTHLYELIYEAKTSLFGLVSTYFFLTMSVILLFGILYYVNAVEYQPPGMLSPYPMHLEKDAFYFSSTTYFTIGYGDIIPIGANARTLSAFEAFFGNVINLVVLAMAFRTLVLQSRRKGRK